MQFIIKSKLDVQLRITREYWKIIVEIKHPAVAKHEKEVKKSIQESDEIRRSKNDPQVYLYYKKFAGKYMCVVARHENKQGFIITTYFTKKIKEGELVWKK